MKHKITTIPVRGLAKYAIPRCIGDRFYAKGYLDLIIEAGYSASQTAQCLIQSQADNKILVKAGGSNYTLERGCYIPLSIAALGVTQIYFFGIEGDTFTVNCPLLHSASWEIDIPDEPPTTFNENLKPIDF